MQLPIDCKTTHFPIKEKYIDSETPALSYWMVFGNFADGTVAICDGNSDDVFTHMEPDMAARIVAARNAWVRSLLDTLNLKIPLVL
jgi:hypothetical protein